MLTVQQVEQALPPNMKNLATQAFTDRINNIVSDPEVAEQVRANFITYSSVLQEGRYTSTDYLNAITYVSYKLMGVTNLEAYTKTFPQRYQQLVAKGTASKDIAAYVSAYNRGKLVNAIFQQTMVPFWVLNQDVYQKAINTQLDLMQNANSEKVRSDAANSILTHLKPPEAKEINLNLGVKENSGLTELKDAMRQLAEQQKAAISDGTPTKLIAAQPIVEAEFSEVGPDKAGTR